MQVDDVLRFTNLLKNLWRLYAIIPDDRKNDVYADICRVESRMSADTYTQVIDNLISLWPQPAALVHISCKRWNVYQRRGQGERRDTLHFNGFFSKKKRAKNWLAARNEK